MTDQQIYEVAEWLVYNVETLSARYKYSYSHMNKEDALMYILAESKKYSYPDMALAFQDERVRIVLDRYYLKEVH